MTDRNDYAKSFVESWLANIREPSRERQPLSKHTVDHDEWDTEALEGVSESIKPFAVSVDRLATFAPVSGASLHEDAFLALYKSMPELHEPGDVRGTHLINRAVMGEAMGLPEYEQLHIYSSNDEVIAAQAAIKVEPDIEVILDRLNAERDAAKRLSELMDDYIELLSKRDDLSDILGDDDPVLVLDNEDEDGGDEPGESSGAGGESGDPQDQVELIEEQMRRLQELMRLTADEIDKGIDGARSDIRASLIESFQGSTDDAKAEMNAATAWGLEPSQIKELDPVRRLQLAEKLDDQKFREISDLLGRNVRFALGCQVRKVDYVPEEVYDIENGQDLARLIPSELAGLVGGGLLRLDFLRRYADHNLLQYKLRGTDKQGQGGVYFCGDGSGSMAHRKEVWAKAFGLTLCRIAHEQNRDFVGIHFGSTGQTTEFDFRGDGFDGEVSRSTRGTFSNEYPDMTMDYIDGVVNFAELFYGSGTDFMTPVGQCIDHLQDEFDKYGAVKGDIVFCTDGHCGVHQDWLVAFKEAQERLGFRMWGVLIGLEPKEPLLTLCDAGIFTINDLVSTDELADMFERF
jgi:uncharacterized protein with von Willebrand factor type A (vWA) domain